MSFKHLYRRPLFTAVINSTTNQVVILLSKFPFVFFQVPIFNFMMEQLLKKASREAKVACGINSGDPWSTPISATLTTHSTRMAASAQRARGYLDKIAKVITNNNKLLWRHNLDILTLLQCRLQLVHMTSWAGSPSYREKALLRCQQAHRLLGEAIKKEFADWIDKLHLEIAFNTNTALHKMAVRRHFKRHDWIQTNLDGYV